MKTPNTLCPINNHTLLLVRGPDAKQFLQGQVTCDIKQLSLKPGDNNVAFLNSSLGAHCTHKGRIVFNFRALALDEQTVALKLPQEMMETATNALKKYIVFSKAELIDASDDYQLVGLQGEQAGASIQQTLGVLPSIDINDAVKTENGIILTISANRYELWLRPDHANNIQQTLADYTLETSDYWDFLTLNQGIAEIGTATSEHFTPHAINLQQTANGVSFTKGCYTGQEVVARMEYLGKLKRSLFLFEYPSQTGSPEDSRPKAGEPLFTPNKPQSIGEVIQVAHYEKSTHLLASVSTEHVHNNQVYSDQACQEKLEQLPLP